MKIVFTNKYVERIFWIVVCIMIGAVVAYIIFNNYCDVRGLDYYARKNLLNQILHNLTNFQLLPFKIVDRALGYLCDFLSQT